jgi:hypothetical protein
LRKCRRRFGAYIVRNISWLHGTPNWTRTHLPRRYSPFPREQEQMDLPTVPNSPSIQRKKARRRREWHRGAYASSGPFQLLAQH